MFTSPFADVEIPELSIFDYLFTGLERDDLERVALIDPATGAETTYAALRAQIEAFAGAVAARGVGVGTVMAVLCPNVPAFATVFHGILRAGGTVTTVNSLYTAGEIEKQLRDAGATWLVTVHPLLPQAQIAAEAAGIPHDRVIVLDGAPGHPNLRDLLTAGAPAPEVSFDPATHVAVLPYSSGTTGVPKGVMLSHRNLVANVEQCRVSLDLRETDRVLAVLPFFHIYGMTVLLNLALRQRAGLVTMPKFDLVEFLTNIQNFGCTYLYIAPPIAVALAKHPVVDQFDISSVHTVFSGAAPLDGETAELAGRRINARMMQGYGMSELSPVSHAMPVDRHDIPVSSVGTMLPNTLNKLIDTETGEEITDVGPDGVTKPGDGCRGHRRARRRQAGDPQGVHRARARQRTHPGRGDGVRGRARRAAQEGAPGGVHRGDPEVRGREDPPQRPAGARGGSRLRFSPTTRLAPWTASGSRR